MAKEELIELMGVVNEVLPDTRFRDAGQWPPIDRLFRWQDAQKPHPHFGG